MYRDNILQTQPCDSSKREKSPRRRGNTVLSSPMQLLTPAAEKPSAQLGNLQDGQVMGKAMILALSMPTLAKPPGNYPGLYILKA